MFFSFPLNLNRYFSSDFFLGFAETPLLQNTEKKWIYGYMDFYMDKNGYIIIHFQSKTPFEAYFFNNTFLK